MSEVCEIGDVRHLYDTETHVCIRCGINEPTPSAPEQPPSKDQLRLWRQRVENFGGFQLTKPESLALFDRIDKLETALTGIQSCSTCEACRGAATRALGGKFTCVGGCGAEVPSKDGYCSACFLKARAERRSEPPVEIRALFNKAVGFQEGTRIRFAFETVEEADRAFEYIGELGNMPTETTEGAPK